MPDQEVAFLDQKAVMWAWVGTDRYGQPKVLPPVEVDVRWDDTTTEVTDPHGAVRKIDAEVVVDQDVPVRSIMWRGALVDLPDIHLIPKVGIMQVVKFDKTGDLKARAVFRMVFLMRWKDTLPTIVPEG